MSAFMSIQISIAIHAGDMTINANVELRKSGAGRRQ